MKANPRRESPRREAQLNDADIIRMASNKVGDHIEKGDT